MFEGEVFGMVYFAVEIRISVECFVRSMMLGSCNSFCMQRVSKSSQFALFIFQ